VSFFSTSSVRKIALNSCVIRFRVCSKPLICASAARAAAPALSMPSRRELKRSALFTSWSTVAPVLRSKPWKASAALKPASRSLSRTSPKSLYRGFRSLTSRLSRSRTLLNLSVGATNAAIVCRSPVPCVDALIPASAIVPIAAVKSLTDKLAAFAAGAAKFIDMFSPSTVSFERLTAEIIMSTTSADSDVSSLKARIAEVSSFTDASMSDRDAMLKRATAPIASVASAAVKPACPNLVKAFAISSGAKGVVTASETIEALSLSTESTDAAVIALMFASPWLNLATPLTASEKFPVRNCRVLPTAPNTTTIPAACLRLTPIILVPS